MARNRMIRPEFWEDDKIGECSPTARLLFIALWNFADDEGYLEYRTKWIKAKCFPYDELKIEPLIDELLHIGCLERHGDILWIKNFLKHQKIEKPYKSKLSQMFKDSPNVPRILPERSPPKIEVKLSEIEEKLSEVKTSSYEEEAVPESLQNSEILSSLTETYSTPPVPPPPPNQEELVQFGKPEVNAMLGFLKASLKNHLKLEAFVDSSNERNMANHCVNLCKKIGKEEFLRRFEIIVNDDFKQKNCNSIRYIYNQIKGFIETKSNSSMVSA